MSNTAFQDNSFQDSYPDDLAHCYGCGKNNKQGHQLKSYWIEGEDKTIAHFKPESFHTAIPGFVYGGLLASLIDCHGTGSASAMASRNAPDSSEAHRFVTGALNVSYLAPTPITEELELIGSFVEVKERKIVVEITLSANNIICAKGTVIAVRMPDSMTS